MDLIEIMILILLVIILLIFIALPLYLTARMVDEDEGLLKALGTTIVLIITFLVCLSLLPSAYFLNFIVAIFVNLLIIKVFYDTDWPRAAVMWIVTIIMAVIIIIVVGIGFLGLEWLLSG